MTHVRKQMRDAAVVLVTNLATTGDRVKPTRVFPKDASDGACLGVFTLEEEIEAATLTAPKRYERILKLVIEGVAQDTATELVDDILDRINVEVEAALDADNTLGGLAKDIQLSSITIEVPSEGGIRTGGIEMSWDVTYHTNQGAPEVAA